MSEQQAPLDGVRVLAVEQYGAGPFGTQQLADLGAEVIKIEDPEAGDVARYVPPYLAEQDSVYFQALNRNKKSVALDLREVDGRAAFEALVKRSHAVFNNLRGDQPARRGLDYASLADVNPSIVCVHLSGFGREGPQAVEPGYDYLFQGYAGWMSLTGEPGTPPQKSGLSLVDLSAGIAAALGLVSELRHAERTGTGRDVDVTLYDTALSLLTYVGAWHLTAGYEPQRQPDSSHPSQVPSQVLPTADGYLVVMCAKEKFYQRLVTEMGRPDLALDPRFSDFSARLENREGLVAILKDLSRQRTTDEWLGMLRGKVPCAPVNTVVEALETADQRDMVIAVPHEDFGEVRQLAGMVRVAGHQRAHVRGPRLGEHTAEVLREIGGLGDDEIQRTMGGARAADPQAEPGQQEEA